MHLFLSIKWWIISLKGKIRVSKEGICLAQVQGQTNCNCDHVQQKSYFKYFQVGIMQLSYEVGIP